MSLSQALNQFAQNLGRYLIERGVELWVYRCEFCGCWHLTHRDPQSSYRHVPLNQQLKPHSRKKGYKPRRR
ncbi:hypothetical protein GBB51_10995 [Bifidobacterium longum]|nr:hypothetical protein GBB51_10995 [Bifidobacterium longum]